MILTTAIWRWFALYEYFLVILCICICAPEYHATRPVFGQSLESHLKQTGREISVVIEECINILNHDALDEEVNSLMSSFYANSLVSDTFDDLSIQPLSSNVM